MKLLTLICLLLTLATCGAPISKKNLLVLGDSNGERQGWVYQLQQLRGGGPLTNTSISGNTIDYKYGGSDLRLSTVENLSEYLRNGYAEMGAIDEILIGLGTNDCKVEFGQDATEIGANLERLLDATTKFFGDRGQETPRIVILSPPPLDDRDKQGEFANATACTVAVTAAYRRIATERGHCFVDLQNKPGPRVLEDSRDGIHFGKDGYVMIAQSVLRACY